MPGSYALITAGDIPGTNRLEDLPVPILASSSLSYLGEPVAILVGPGGAKLEEYAALCTVQAEEESPFFFRGSAPKSPMAVRNVAIGDTGGAFAGAASVMTGTYRTGIQEHWYSEPTGAAAVFSHDKGPRDKNTPPQDPGDTLVIHTATQWPFHVKRSAAAVLKLPPERIVVEPSLIGVHLDGKIWYPSLVACHAALGAFLLKKPVKIMLTREEDFRYSPKRCGAEIAIRSAQGERGQLLAVEIDLITDLGAHGVFTDEILDRTCLGTLGTYRCGNIRLRGSAIETNIPPGGPLGGFGMSQGFFAMERHVSRIADALRQDPAEWRKNNMYTKNAPLAIGIRYKEHIPMEEILDTATSMSDYHRKWASYELLRGRRREGKEEKNEPLRGIGIAAAYQGSGFLYTGSDKGAYAVELTLEKDGVLEIRTSMISADREHIYLWQNIAAEILTIEAGAVRIIANRTDLTPDSGPAALSRNVTVITRLVERACVAIRKQRFRDPLPITVRRSYRPNKAPDWEGKLFDQNALSRLSWGAAVVEVAIDPVEYIPRIRGAWLGLDGGRILSETRARRSLKLSVIHALGWASQESLAYDSGNIPPGCVHKYGMIGPEDIPPIHIDFVWNDTINPTGIGELPFNCIPAAYVQAVSQAVDYPFEKIPVTAGDVWEIRKSGEMEDEQ
jgi:CO/xanthine dehydrogenase Mo-binding subunit